MERSPLYYPLTRSLTCFDPKIVADLPTAEKRLSKTLEICVAHNIISGVEADKIEREYKEICRLNISQAKMKNYKRQETRLQDFWFSLLDSGFTNLQSFLKIIFILSHGNAALERGFSVNKECLVENLQEQSLIAQRLIYDSIIELKGLENLNITKGLILSTRNAHSRYKEVLEQKKLEDNERKKKQEEKRKAVQVIKELQTKKQKIMEEANREVSVIEEKIVELKA